MSDGVGIWRCANCGAGFFPRRLLCLRCHSPDLHEDRIHAGTVEEIVVVRHVLGQTDWKPRRIANVRADEGIAMTVGLVDDADIGDTITLFQEDTAPLGRKAG